MTTCHNCGDAIAEYKDEERKLGRCCVGLPGPWGRDEDGLYTVSRPRSGPLGATVPDDDEDEASTGPCCLNCGAATFVFIETCTVSRTNSYCVDASDEETLTLDRDNGTDEYEDDSEDDHEITRVECRNCGVRYNGAWEYA